MMDVVRGTKVKIGIYSCSYRIRPVCKGKLMKIRGSGLVRVASQRSKAFVASGTWSCGQKG